MFAGDNLFRRALNVTLLPNLRRILGTLLPNWNQIFRSVPRIVRGIAGAAITPIVRGGLFLLKFEFEQDFRSFMKFVQPRVLTICKLSHIDLAILFS